MHKEMLTAFDAMLRAVQAMLLTIQPLLHETVPAGPAAPAQEAPVKPAGSRRANREAAPEKAAKPEAPTAAPAEREIPYSEIREAILEVAEHKSHTIPVRVLKEFGVTAGKDLPPAKRREFLEALRNAAAAWK